MRPDSDPAVGVRFLTGDDHAGLDGLYADVLAPSFPPAELVESQTLLDSLRRGDGFVAVAVDADATVVGGMVADWYADSGVLLVSYLAVRPGIRGRGIGHALLDAALPAWRRALAPLVVLAEVEDPRYYTDTGYGDPVARLRLYARYGARFLPVPYLQPELRRGLGRVPHLRLIVFAVAESASPAPDRVDGAVIERFLDAYFTESEGPAQVDDPDLARLRQACREPGGLPLLDLAQILPPTTS